MREILIIIIFVLFPYNLKCESYSTSCYSTASSVIDLPCELNPQTLEKVINYYNLSNSDIVIAQAILETGNFKSRICIEYNNIFGLYDTSNHRYYRFTSWQECVLFYKIKIQSRYKGGDYLTFLERINYAEATDYTKRLKELIMG